MQRGEIYANRAAVTIEARSAQLNKRARSLQTTVALDHQATPDVQETPKTNELALIKRDAESVLGEDVKGKTQASGTLYLVLRE